VYFTWDVARQPVSKSAWRFENQKKKRTSQTRQDREAEHLRNHQPMASKPKGHPRLPELCKVYMYILRKSHTMFKRKEARAMARSSLFCITTHVPATAQFVAVAGAGAGAGAGGYR